MKFVVSGTRRLRDYGVVTSAMTTAIEKFNCVPTVIIEGGQRTWERGKVVGGADWFAFQWAMAHHVEVRTVQARWDVHGKAAGPIRNREMAYDGDYLVAIPDQQSRGTTNMIQAMYEAGKSDRVYVHVLEQ